MIIIEIEMWDAFQKEEINSQNLYFQSKSSTK